MATAATVTIAEGAAISATEIDFTTGAYTIAADSGGSLAITGSGTVDVAPTIADTISAPLVGGDGLSLPDSGTLEINGADSYTGATVIADGMLQLDNSLALRSTTSVSSTADGTLDLNGQSIGSAVPLDDFAGTITNSVDAPASFAATINATTQDSFAVDGNGNISLDATVVGSSTTTLTKSGGNTLTLGDASEFNGLSVVVADGSVVQAAGGTMTSLEIGAGSTVTIPPTGSGHTWNTLYWDPSQTGPTTGIASGGPGTWDTTSNDWYSLETHEDQAWSDDGQDSAVFTGAADTVTLDTGISADAVTFQTDGYILTDGSLAISGSGFNVSPGIAATINSTLDGTLGLIKIGTGNLIVGGTTNSYTGPTMVLYGTLTAASTDAFGDSNGISSHPGATLDLNGQTIGSSVPLALFQGTLTNNSATSPASFAGPVNYDSFFPIAPNFTVSGISDITLSGAVDEYGQTLTKTGDNALILSGTDDDIGVNLVVNSGTVELDKASSSSVHAIDIGITLSGGTIQLAGTGGDQIADGAPIVIDSGTLDTNGQSETVANLSGSGGTITNSHAISISTLTVGAGNADGVFAGQIQDDGTGTIALVKIGSGTQILDGENDYSEGTNIEDGTLQLGDGATSNGSIIGNVNDAGSLVFAGITAQSYSGAISGTGSVIQSGYNALTLTGANIYTGVTSVNSGALILGIGGSLGNTAITVANGAAFDPQPGSGTVSAGGTGSGSAGATFTLASGSTFDMTDGSVGTFNLQQQSSFSGTTLSIDTATLNFDLSSGGADELATTGAASVSGVNTINITGLSAGMTTGQNFTLISAVSGLSGTFEFANGTNTESLSFDDQTYTLQLTNTGAAETVAVTAIPNYAVFINGTFTDGSTTVDLGSTYANEPTIATVMIENEGSRTLTLSDPISLPSGFTLAADYGTVVLASGQSTTFAIRLDSPVEGSFSGTLSIATDDPVQPTFDVPITGEVVARVAGVNDSNFDSSGDAWTTVSNTGAVGGQELTAPAGTGQNTTSWVFNDLDPTLQYQVFATWIATTGQATNATYTILDGSSSEGPLTDNESDTPNAPYVVGTLGTVAVDQTAAPSGSTVAGIAWSSLGNFTATSGVMEIDLSDDANGTVVAGGVRVVAVHVTEPPVLQPITDQTATAGDDLSIQLGASDPDVSSGDLSYSLLNTTPPGMSIDSSTGLITWDTTGVFAGTYTTTVQVSDGGSPPLADTKLFSITVNNSSSPTSGSGEDVVSVYDDSDAMEGGSAGNIRLLRTGDLTSGLTVMYQIDETVSNAAQYGSTEEYVGPDVGSPVDGILYGYASFAAGAATTDIPINASADTDNADNPTVNFELLPYGYTIPGDANPDLTISGGGDYAVSSPSTAAPAIDNLLHVNSGSTTVGLGQLVSDHKVLTPITSKGPPGVMITYAITDGNGEGMFTLTTDGKLLLARNAAAASAMTYSLSISGTGTFEGQEIKSIGTETVTIDPELGIYGDTMATRNTDDIIELTFVRYSNDLSLALTVNFSVTWASTIPGIASLTRQDLQHNESYNTFNSGQIVIPAGQSTVSLDLLAAPLAEGESVAGLRTLEIDLTNSSDGRYTYQRFDANTHLADANADTVLSFENLFVLDAVTAFAAYNKRPELADNLYGEGIDPNDVSQGTLGDCYFMAAELAVAQSDPGAIRNLITQIGPDSFSVEIYDDPAKDWLHDGITGWRSFTITDNILSNGSSMAELSRDYNTISGAVEIWPQLLEAAWMKLNGGTYQNIVSGATSDALIAITGRPYTYIPVTGMTNQQIGQTIQAELASGPAAIGTLPNEYGKKSALSLAPNPGKIYYDHAYVVESVGTDGDGNITNVVLLNPWGKLGNDYRIKVPLIDFNKVFANIFGLPQN